MIRQRHQNGKCIFEKTQALHIGFKRIYKLNESRQKSAVYEYIFGIN